MPLLSNNLKGLASGLLLEGNTMCQIFVVGFPNFLSTVGVTSFQSSLCRKHEHGRQAGRQAGHLQPGRSFRKPRPRCKSLAILQHVRPLGMLGPQLLCEVGELTPMEDTKLRWEKSRVTRFGKTVWPTQWTWLFLFNMQLFWWQSKSRCSEIAYYPPPTVCARLPRGHHLKRND